MSQRYKTITIGDNGHAQRSRSAEGKTVYIERSKNWMVGDRLHVRWRDDFETVAGGLHWVVSVEPSEPMPQGQWFIYGLRRIEEES